MPDSHEIACFVLGADAGAALVVLIDLLSRSKARSDLAWFLRPRGIAALVDDAPTRCEITAGHDEEPPDA